MNADFGGFTVGTGGGKMTGVENLVLNNLAETSRTFDATGVTGLKKIAIDANEENFTVSNIAAAGATGIAVDIQNAGGALTLGFGTAVTAATATADKLTLTVTDAEALDVTAAGIETLVVVSNGDANVLDLSLGGTKTVTVSGSGDLSVSGVDTGTLTALDTSALTGDLTATVAASTKLATVTTGSGVDTLSIGSSAITSISTGAGNDVLTVTGMKSNTVLSGGVGTDTLTLSKLSGTFAPTISGFETLRFSDSSAITVSGANISDVTTISLRDDQSGNITISGMPNTSVTLQFADASTATTYGTSANTVNYTGAAAITLSLSSVETTTATAETIATSLTAGNATSLVATVGAYVNATGNFNVGNASSVALTVSENGSYATGSLTAARATSAALTANGSFNTAMNVDKASTLTVTVGANGSLGSNADFNAAEASTVTITSDDTDGFDLDLNAPKATSVTIDSDGPVGVDSTTDLSAVQTLTLKGAASSFAMTTAGMIGDKSSSVTVDASDLEGSLSISIGDYASADGSLEIIGSELGTNTITIEGGRNEVVIAGGISKDQITFQKVITGEGVYSFDLGTVSTDDIVTFATGSDLTDASVTFAGVDQISFGTAGALSGSSISGQTIKLTGTAITIEGSVSADVIDLSDITLTAGGLSVDGGSGNDVITGTSVAATLKGGVGDDSIVGGDGADIIYGGTGADTMSGGSGTDTFVIQGGETTISGLTRGTALTNLGTLSVGSADVILDFNTSGVDEISFDPTTFTHSLAYTSNATPEDNTVTYAMGTYNSATKVFTYDTSITYLSTNAEKATLVIYDANPAVGTTSVAFKAIVLVGYVAGLAPDTDGNYTGLTGDGG